MNKIIISALLNILSFIGFSQSNQSELIATKISQKMQDSLSLTENQKMQVFNINMHLSNQKDSARQQYSGSSLGFQIQKVVNMRDSLYHGILPYNKFLFYRQQKRNLITNN
mgnify:CR=1 FL=1